MTSTIDEAFVRQFEAEVHQAYQRSGSKLRATVRSRADIRAASTTFQKIGKGEATTKSRHGHIPVMNLDHTPVTCTLIDYYAGEWVDRLDELKLAHDERDIVTKAGAHALGRKTDQLILAELDASTRFAGGESDGLTLPKVLAAFEMLGQSDVPDDGQRYAVVGWRQWSDLLAIPEFASADYVGDDRLPFRGGQAKQWLGTLWIPHSGLTRTAAGKRLCHWYHRTAVGHASGAEVQTDVTWHGDRASWFVANWMSQGARLIDTDGVVTLRCAES